jgi:hypothetical protein
MNKKGQVFLEYFFLILAVVAALIGMQFSIKRAIIAKWRETADVFGYGRQYEPGVTQVSDRRVLGWVSTPEEEKDQKRLIPKEYEQSKEFLEKLKERMGQ